GAGPAKLPVESPDQFPDGRECVETPPVAEIELRLRPQPRRRQGRGDAQRAAVVAWKLDAGSSRKHLRNRLRHTRLHAVLLWLTAPGSSVETRNPGFRRSRGCPSALYSVRRQARVGTARVHVAASDLAGLR